ncbi:FERM domain-containing protein 8 isoform X2 [Hemicordylus capensis]|uniref:FERM domain-containing protein 8 isoform X2 n=1 Tax=Hemicordylus capensis TaxID=884348 RepID=UPI002302C60B|nr:FERM domain-containing protein 8 isoform X2 [Hemicordylus capensis]
MAWTWGGGPPAKELRRVGQAGSAEAARPLPRGACCSPRGGMEADRLAVPPPSADEHSQRSSVSSTGHRTLDVLVYLVNDRVVRLAVEGLPSVTAHELHRLVRDALRLPECALEAFALWLASPLLEVQLKPKHQPYKVCRQWQELLFRFSSCSEDETLEDEPSLQFRRSVFFPKRKELQVQDEAVLQLLYEEAKYNLLEGRYPCDLADCQQLGALACRLDLGPYNPERHTAASLKGPRLLSGLWRRGSRLPAYEQGLLQAFRALPEEEEQQGGPCGEHTPLRTWGRAYLQKCHELPYYGCAFFSGEIDKPAQSFLQRSGRKAVLVAISLEGVYILDSKEKHVLLGLRFQELSWDHTFPDEEEHILWLEFDGESSEGTPVNKLLKVYSKQAELMSGLIEYCIELTAAAAAAAEGTVQEAAASGAPSSEAPPGSQVGRRLPPRLQRQDSVLCSRVQHLSTIDYVEEGKEIRRVKPRRSASFFGRQLSSAPTSYSAVRAAESLEHG